MTPLMLASLVETLRPSTLKKIALLMAKTRLTETPLVVPPVASLPGLALVRTSRIRTRLRLMPPRPLPGIRPLILTSKETTAVRRPTTTAVTIPVPSDAPRTWPILHVGLPSRRIVPTTAFAAGALRTVAKIPETSMPTLTAATPLLTAAIRRPLRSTTTATNTLRHEGAPPALAVPTGLAKTPAFGVVLGAPVTTTPRLAVMVHLGTLGVRPVLVPTVGTSLPAVPITVTLHIPGTRPILHVGLPFRLEVPSTVLA